MANIQGRYTRMAASETPVMQSPHRQASATDLLKRQMSLRIKNSFYLGLIECIFGIILVGLGFGTMGVSSQIYSYEGIWCGTMLSASGIIAVCIRWRTSRSMFVASLTFSILASILTLVMTILSLQATIAFNIPSAIQAVITAFGVVSLIVCIIHVRVSYALLRPGKGRKPTRHSGPVAYAAQPLQMVQLANGQYMMLVPCQPTHQAMSGSMPNPVVYLPQQATTPSSAPPPAYSVTPVAPEIVTPSSGQPQSGSSEQEENSEDPPPYLLVA